ncbi:MAG: phage major capsid protein [Actinomycetota bacterium]
MTITNPRRVGNQWVFPNGRTLPVISGGDTTAGALLDRPQTIEDLRNERARVLDQIDDILNTAREDDERTLTDDERTRHDALVAQIEGDEGLDIRIAAAVNAEADAQREQAQEARRQVPVPNVNLRSSRTPGADVTRSLDALLWASAESVRAGQYDKTGTFRYNPYGAVNTVEPIMIRDEDSDNAVPAPRISAFRQEDQQLIREFQNTVADMALFGMLVDKEARSSGRGFEVARAHRKFKDRWNNLMNALDVDTAGEGQDWVPTGIGATLHEKVRASGKIAPLFSRIDLPTNPWKWPIEGSDSTAYRVAEPTSDTETKMAASTPGTGAPTFDAEIFGARTLISRSLEPDSAIAILPFIRMKTVQAFVDGEEMTLLDGDTDGTHQDADVQALGATDVRTSWDGLRKRALANASSDGGNNAATIADMRTVRAQEKKWGLDPMSFVYIVGVSAYFQLIEDTEVTSIEKYGRNATILSGELGRVNGVPIIVSEHVREDLNATGVQDGVTTNRSYLLGVNRNEWAIGQRMGLDVEVDDSIYRETFQRVMVGFMREDFQNIGDDAANDDTSIVFNIS